MKLSIKLSFVLMSVFYIFAGLYHFINPVFYVEFVPELYFEKEFIIAVSGLLEIVLGLFLLFKQTRSMSAKVIAVMLFVFLIFVHFPMTLDYYDSQNPYLWLTIVRIPIQFALIFWALKVAKYKIKSDFY